MTVWLCLHLTLVLPCAVSSPLKVLISFMQFGLSILFIISFLPFHQGCRVNNLSMRWSLYSARHQTDISRGLWGNPVWWWGQYFYQDTISVQLQTKVDKRFIYLMRWRLYLASYQTGIWSSLLGKIKIKPAFDENSRSISGLCHKKLCKLESFIHMYYGITVW